MVRALIYSLFSLFMLLSSFRSIMAIQGEACPSPAKIEEALNKQRHDPASITSLDEFKSNINQATKIDNYILLSIGKDYTNTNDQRKREMKETPISQMEFFSKEPLDATDYDIKNMLHEKAKQLEQKQSVCAYHGQLNKGKDIYIYIGKPKKSR